MNVQEVQTPYTRAKIRDLNDLFRKTLIGGLLILTRSVAALDHQSRQEVIRAVQRYNSFTEENDPAGEHSFGRVVVWNQHYWFQISYYDRSMEMASLDPTDTYLTKRVLTIGIPIEF